MRAALHDLVRPHAEDEDVFVADMIANLDIGAVERADGQRAVERQLHVAGARGLHAGRRDLFGEVAGRHDLFGGADIVVRNEHDLQQTADRTVVVDDPCDVVDELDDQLGLPIARGGLAGEDLDPRRPVADPARRGSPDRALRSRSH